jgi:hypothetical protein
LSNEAAGGFGFAEGVRMESLSLRAIAKQ